MRFLLYPNEINAEAVAYIQQLQQRLEGEGHTCRRIEEADDAYLRQTDMAMVAGGDGTVLRAVRALHKYDFPFWAVNLGHLGYLTECEPQEAEASLQKIFARRYRVEEHRMLSGCLHTQEGDTPFFGLNEAVIHRGAFARSLRMELAVDGMSILRFKGDGLLVATPTGSTAYNLSAGGPMLLPTSDQLVITPICPHTVMCAPIVVPSRQHVSIRVSLGADDETGALPQLVVDGCHRMTLHEGDMVSCTGSPWHVDFVRTREMAFYRRLQSKMTRSKR